MDLLLPAFLRRQPVDLVGVAVIIQGAMGYPQTVLLLLAVAANFAGLLGEAIFRAAGWGITRTVQNGSLSSPRTLSSTRPSPFP